MSQQKYQNYENGQVTFEFTENLERQIVPFYKKENNIDIEVEELFLSMDLNTSCFKNTRTIPIFFPNYYKLKIMSGNLSAFN